jgi:peroxiredoxin
MKSILICLASCWLLVSAKPEQANFTIKGKVGPYSEHAKAYLFYQLVLGSAPILDSALIKNGDFVFKGSVPYPVEAWLYINHNGTGFGDTSLKRNELYLVPGIIRVTFPGGVDDAKIVGGQVNADYNKIKILIRPMEDERLVLWHKSMGASKEKMKEIEKEEDSLEVLKKAIYEQFIKANPDHLMSLLALKKYENYIPVLEEVEPLFNSLSADVRTSTLGVMYSEEIKKLKTTAVGVMAPDFTQPDTLGKAVSLHDFKGKYVMVDFWASWCGPCREESPDVVKVYQKFKDKGFTILSVSMDSKTRKNAWLKAIHDDHLDWTHVSDLMGFNDNEVAKLYSVQAIPQNFIIGPDGKIVAVNLHGADLDKALSEMLK